MERYGLRIGDGFECVATVSCMEDPVAVAVAVVGRVSRAKGRGRVVLDSAGGAGAATVVVVAMDGKMG